MMLQLMQHVGKLLLQNVFLLLPLVLVVKQLHHVNFFWCCSLCSLLLPFVMSWLWSKFNFLLIGYCNCHEIFLSHLWQRTIHKTKNHWMSWIFTSWTRKLLNQSEIHSFSQAPHQNNLAKNSLKPSLHWNNEGLQDSIRPFYFVQCSLPESQPGYNEKWSQLTERGPPSFKRSLF